MRSSARPVPLYLVLTLLGCPAAPSSKVYHPSNPEGRVVSDKSRRDLFPDDVRKDPAKYRETWVAWSGIVTERSTLDTPAGRTLRIVIDHHYWDWVQDFGVQKEQMFLSPRGEGKFGFAVAATGKPDQDTFLPLGSMALVFGPPSQVDPKGIVVLDYKWTVTIPKELFATDFWDYGRDYLLKHDKSDFKRLRTF